MLQFAPWSVQVQYSTDSVLVQYRLSTMKGSNLVLTFKLVQINLIFSVQMHDPPPDGLKLHDDADGDSDVRMSTAAEDSKYVLFRTSSF